MRISAIAVAATIVWATGCATYHDTRADADRALERTLRAEMSRYGDLAVNAPGVQFASRDGAVTLTGTVPSEKDREMLNSMVRNTAGVVAVNDDLRVLTPTGLPGVVRVYPPAAIPPAPVYSVPPPATPPGTIVVAPTAYPGWRILSTGPSDELVARRIGDQLARDSVTARSLEDVTLTVAGENAYLQGVVSSPAARQAIVSSVARTAGVKAVYDQLQIR